MSLEIALPMAAITIAPLAMSAEIFAVNVDNDVMGGLFGDDPVVETAEETATTTVADDDLPALVEWDATPLVGAIRRGDVEAVKNLSTDLSNINLQADGMSLLYLAVFKQRESVVEYLISRGANVNARNEEDFDSPLILARRRGDTELIRLLLTPMHRLGGLSVGFSAMLESPIIAVDPTNEECCSICFGDVDENDASTSMAAFEKCGHACCSGCMSAFLSACIADTTSLSLTPVIRCFARGCDAPVSYRDFEKFAPREASQLYQVRLTTAACRLMPEFSWCTKCESGGFITTAPIASSSSAASASSSVCKDVSCDACKHSYCADCREDAHTGLTCTQKYEQVMSGDTFITERMSARAIQKYTKPCPQCAAPTIRDGGCSHMTCRACSYAWCWFCCNAYTGRYTFGNKCPCGS